MSLVFFLIKFEPKEQAMTLTDVSWNLFRHMIYKFMKNTINRY